VETVELEDQHKKVLKKLLNITTHLQGMMNGLAILESLAKNPPPHPLTDRELRRVLATFKEDLPGMRFELSKVLARYERSLKCFIEEETDNEK
jgi:hypothetical protein